MKHTLKKVMLISLACGLIGRLYSLEENPGVIAPATSRGVWLPPSKQRVGYTYQSPYKETASLDVAVLTDAIFGLKELESECLVDSLSPLSLKEKETSQAQGEVFLVKDASKPLYRDDIMEEINALIASITDTAHSLEDAFLHSKGPGINFELIQELQEDVKLTESEEKSLSLAFTSLKNDFILNENNEEIALTDLEMKTLKKAFNFERDKNLTVNSSSITKKIRSSNPSQFGPSERHEKDYSSLKEDKNEIRRLKLQLKIREWESLLGIDREVGKSIKEEMLNAFENFVFVDVTPPQEFEKKAEGLPKESFYISSHPITNADYLEYMLATKKTHPFPWGSRKIPEGIENKPVIGLSYLEAEAYAKWKDLRLPTSAELELAESLELIELDPNFSEWVLVEEKGILGFLKKKRLGYPEKKNICFRCVLE